MTLFRHCEPTGRRNALPDDRLREAIHSAKTGRTSGLLRRYAPRNGGGSRLLKAYSITACSGATDCLRSEALVEPIMIAKGIAHRVKIITIW